MVTLHVNGKKHEVDAAPDTPQRWVLRGMALCAACIAAAAGAAG
jgi:aerobic-type carbon monoxide dehydrogenase small subunit (CoxS/CutS family)